MLVYVFTAIAILGYFALRSKKPQSKIAKAVDKEAKELLLFISLIGATFSVIQIAIDLMPVTPDDSLLSLERKIVWLRRVTDSLTMPAWVQVLSFMGLLFFAFLSTRMARLKAIGRLSATNTYIAKAHLILTLASALTFFGTGTANGAAHKQAMLVAQIEETTRGYEDAAKAVEKDAIRAAVAEITNTAAHPETGNLVVAVNTSRDTAKKIESTDKRLPSVKDYDRNRTDYVDAPRSYQLAADIADIQKDVADLPARNGGDYHVPSSASLATNAEIKEVTGKNGDAVAADEFKTAVAESVDAAYDSATDKVISVIAAHISPHNLPAQLLEVLLKKVGSDGVKEFLKDRVAETLTAIYEKHTSPKETISAMRQTVRNWISAQNRDDLSQVDQTLASSAKEAEQAVERESADVSRTALDFADARAQRLAASSRELVSKVILSNSSEIESIWTGIRNEGASSEANHFERLGASEKRYAIAMKLHDAGDSTTDAHGSVKSAAAIEYEALCCGTQRLSEAYAVEADRILAAEKRSYWGRVRAIAESSVAENTMNYDLSNLEAAKKAISNWRSFSAKIAVASAKGGSSADKLSSEQWDKWFAEYLTKHADMAALWGFIVISTTDDDSVWEPYYQERIREATFKTDTMGFKNLPSTKYRSPLDGSIDYSLLAENLAKNKFNVLGQNKAVARAAETKIRAHGPYPKDGYRYFMSRMHVQNDADAATYFSSSEAERYIDKFCPRTQLSR